MKITSVECTRTAAALASGFLLTGAFPKADLAWLAWFALVPLLVSVRDLSAGPAFRMGFIAGLAHYLTLIYWVIPTMRTYGQLPLILCVPVLFLFASALAIFIATFSTLAATICRGSGYRWLLLAPLWVGLEYFRSFFLTGFPWELLGYSQHRVVHLIQIADLFGVYGVSFVIVLCNAGLSLIVVHLTGGVRSFRPAAVSILAACVVLGGVLVYGKVRISAIDRRTSTAPTDRVAVVQGNIDQAVKWDRAFQVSTVEKYLALSASTRPDRPSLVIWPETAAPFYFQDNVTLTEMVIEGVRRNPADFLIGSNSVNRTQSGDAYFNSAYLIAPDGTVVGRYDKAHLVPYGEYVPLRKWLPFIGKMVEHVGDFHPGEKGGTLGWQDKNLGPLICYEVIFPSLARKMVKNGADLLINITNDAWYGRSSAPYQHFSMAVFRAVENRRALVRSANTGISGFIDPVGRVTASTALFQTAALTQTVPFLSTSAVYTRIGDLFAQICLAAAAATGVGGIFGGFRPH